MKNRFILFPFLALLISLNFACETDRCKRVNCGDTQAYCADGICRCFPGYESNRSGLCTIESRSKILGAWLSEDACSITDTSSQIVSVDFNPNSVPEVFLLNFKPNFRNGVVANIHENNITILRQSPNNDAVFLEGSGVISGSIIVWNYKISDERNPSNVQTELCNSTWRR